MIQKRTTSVIILACIGLAGWSARIASQPNAKAEAIPAARPAMGAGGEIRGKVLFQGEKPRLATIQMEADPVCAELHTSPVYVEDGAVNSDGTLPNVFIFVKHGLENQTFPIPSKPVILDQHTCVYQPHVLGVMAGQELLIVSSDPTTHNIHPMPKDNREWNQSQPPGAAPMVKRFAHPEIMIPVKCNQHPWMRAYIGVSSNPFYAVTGADGTFAIKGLPAGEYTIGAWTATFGAQEEKIIVPANESIALNFTFTAR